MSNRVYDCIRRPFDPTAPRYTVPSEHLLALPLKIDLRGECPPVYDQGQLGSCTGNGWAFIVQWLLITLFKLSWIPSRLFIYYYERVLEGDPDTDNGATVADGGQVLSTEGVCRETTWPYAIEQFSSAPSPAAIAEALLHKISGLLHIDNSKIEEVKSALASGSPIVIGFTVYESFESGDVSSSGLVPIPVDAEQVLGGHCVDIVGYDDTFAFPSDWAVLNGAFIVRNSWGVAWGLNGYCMVPYAYFTNPDLASDFWIAKKVA